MNRETCLASSTPTGGSREPRWSWYSIPTRSTYSFSRYTGWCRCAAIWIGSTSGYATWNARAQILEHNTPAGVLCEILSPRGGPSERRDSRAGFRLEPFRRNAAIGVRLSEHSQSLGDGAHFGFNARRAKVFFIQVSTRLTRIELVAHR